MTPYQLQLDLNDIERDNAPPVIEQQDPSDLSEIPRLRLSGNTTVAVRRKKLIEMFTLLIYGNNR